MKQIKFANPKQKWLFERGPAPTLLCGGVNSGKSVGCVLKMLTLLHTYPGSRGAIIRRSHSQLSKTTMETFFQWVGPEFYRPKGGFNSQSGILDLNNGSRVYFLHLDNPDSLDVLAGLELNFAYVSQAEEISEKAWDLLDVRLGRWTGATVPQNLIDAYPGGRDKWPWKSEADPNIIVPPRYLFAESYVTDETHWLYRRFANSSPDYETWKKLGYDCQIVNSEENMFAIKATLDAANAKDADYIRRYVRPQWGNPEGSIFNLSPISLLDYSPSLMDRIKRHMRNHRSMDHGDTAPTVVLNEAVDHDGNIFVWREYYVENMLVSQHRKALYELSKEDPHCYSQLADPSIFSKSRGRTAVEGPKWSIADEWSDTRTLPPITAIAWQGADNNEEATISRMKEYLYVDPNHRHPITGELGSPRIFFIQKSSAWPNGCDMVIKEIRGQRRKKIAVSGDKTIWSDDRDDKVVDHSYDACKYFVVSRPSMGTAPPPAALPQGIIPIQAYRDADKADRKRQRKAERLSGVSRSGWGY